MTSLIWLIIVLLLYFYLNKRNEELQIMLYEAENKISLLQKLARKEVINMEMVNDFLRSTFKDILRSDGNYDLLVKQYKDCIGDIEKQVFSEYPMAHWEFEEGFGNLTDFIRGGPMKIIVYLGSDASPYKRIRWLNIRDRKATLLPLEKTLSQEDFEMYQLLKNESDKDLEPEDVRMDAEVSAQSVPDTVVHETTVVKESSQVIPTEEDKGIPYIQKWYASKFSLFEKLKTQAQMDARNSFLFPMNELPEDKALQEEIMEACMVSWGYESVEMTQEGLRIQF